MRNVRPAMLLLMAVFLSWGMSAAQTKPAATAKPTSTTARPRAATPALAAADPFIGVWKLSADKSKYEQGGAPRGFTRTYEDRGGGTIFMITDVTVQGGSARSYLVYKRDGKAYPEAAVGADSIRMVTVRSINPRTEEMSFTMGGQTSQTPSTITISPDGMTMTQVLSGTTSKGKAFTNTVVYERQP
jgi:hypothetical protein